MNKDYSEIDKILDEIILGKAGEEKLANLINGENREDLLKDLLVHQSAAAIVQRNAVITQVRRIHIDFIEKRNGFTANDIPYTRNIVVKRNPLKFWWSVAAAVIIVPALLLLFLYSTNSPSKLFASQYQTYRINVDRSSGQGNAVPLIEDYQKAQYNDVIKDYQALSSQGVREKMITGFAYMELKQYDAAIPLFDAVIRQNILSGERLYQDEAEYYLALSLLKTNQVKRSYQLFDKIYVDEEHTFNGRVDKWFMMRLKLLL